MKKDSIIVAGDVGGTKCLLALFQIKNGKTSMLTVSEYASSGYSDFYSLVSEFLEENPAKPEIAVFGIPGPIKNGEVKSTNLPWFISEKELSRDTGIPRVKLLNDLAATAYSLPGLPAKEIDPLISGEKTRHPQRYVVIAPGTGLGQAFLICKDDKKIIVPSEGGHATFAPAGLPEAELFRFLHKKYGRVSNERIISGSGLPNVFDFLVEDQKQTPEKETLENMKTRDRAIVISEMALSNKDQVCVQAMDIFVSALAAHAANLALTFMPDGGIFLAGGIPHKIFPKLSDGLFEKAFLNAGKMKSVVKSIPVYVINNNRAALKGAAQLAFELINQNNNE